MIWFNAFPSFKRCITLFKCVVTALPTNARSKPNLSVCRNVWYVLLAFCPNANTVSTIGTQLVFSGVTKYVTIRAHKDNNDTVYIGDFTTTSVGVNALAFLEPGDAVKLDFDDVDVALYAISATAGQKVMVGALL